MDAFARNWTRGVLVGAIVLFVCCVDVTAAADGQLEVNQACVAGGCFDGDAVLHGAGRNGPKKSEKALAVADPQ